MNDQPFKDGAPLPVPVHLEKFISGANEMGLMTTEQAEEMRKAAKHGKQITGTIEIGVHGNSITITISETFTGMSRR
jgi:hypothetical protein